MGIGRCSRTEVRDGLICAIQYSGCQPPEKEVFAFCLDFIINNFYMFKLHEFVTAFELYALGELNVDKAIVFNPKLIGDVMNAYKPLSLQVRDKTAPKMPELKNDIQVDEEQAIKDEKEYWEKSKTKDWRMLNYMVFDYLWKRKKITLSEEKREAITNQLLNEINPEELQIKAGIKKHDDQKGAGILNKVIEKYNIKNNIKIFFMDYRWTPTPPVNIFLTGSKSNLTPIFL